MYSFKKGISKFLVLALLLLQLPVAYADSEQEVDLDISNIGIVESIGEDLDTRDLDQANEDSEDLGEGEKLEDLEQGLDKSIGLDQYEDLDGGQTISGYSAPILPDENGVYHPSTGEELRNLLETGGELEVEIGDLSIDKSLVVKSGTKLSIKGKKEPEKDDKEKVIKIYNKLSGNSYSDISRLFIVEPGGELNLYNIELDGNLKIGGIDGSGNLNINQVSFARTSAVKGSAIFNKGYIKFEGQNIFSDNGDDSSSGTIYNEGNITFLDNTELDFSNNKGIGSAIYNEGKFESDNTVFRLGSNNRYPAIHNEGNLDIRNGSSINAAYGGFDNESSRVRLFKNRGTAKICQIVIENGKSNMIYNDNDLYIDSLVVNSDSNNREYGKYVIVEGGKIEIRNGWLESTNGSANKGLVFIDPKEDVSIIIGGMKYEKGKPALVELVLGGQNYNVNLLIEESGLFTSNIVKGNSDNLNIKLSKNNIKNRYINLLDGYVNQITLENNIINGDINFVQVNDLRLNHNTVEGNMDFKNSVELKNNLFVGNLTLNKAKLDLGQASKVEKNYLESQGDILYELDGKKNILLENIGSEDYKNIFPGEEIKSNILKRNGYGGSYNRSYKEVADNSFATGIAKVVLEDNEDMIHNKRDQLHPTFGAIEGKYTRGVYRVRFLDEKGNPIEEEFTEEVDLATEIKIVDSIKDIYGYEYIRTQPSDRLIVSNKTEENIISHYYKNKLSPRLSFHGNGGKFGNGDSIRKFYPKDGDKLATYIPVDLLRSDYDFSNWTLGLNGGKINRDYIIKADDDLHIYANWKKKPDPVKPDPIKPNPDPDPDTKEPEKPDPIKPDPSKPTPKLPEIVPGPGVEDKKITPPDFIEIMFPDIPLGSKLNMVDHFAYIFGYPDSTVRGENNISREEAAAVFYRLLKPSYKELIYSNDKVFTDIMEGRWSFDNISTLNKGGIVSGYPDGNFRPKNNVTRAEIAVMASKFDNLKYDGRNSFSDVEGHWAKHYINSAAMNGWLVGGGSNSNFRPDDYMTRAEFVTMVNRILQRRVRKENALPDLREFKDLKDTSWYYEPMIEAINGHDYQPERLEDGSELWLRLLK